MNKVMKIGVGVLLTAAVLLPSYSFAQTKVAVIQMDKVITAFPEAQRAEETLRAVKDEYEKELEKMDSKLKELQQAAESSYAEARDKAASESEREKRQEAAQQKFVAFQEYQQKLRKQRSENQRDLADQEMRQFKRILGKLREIVSEYATEQKIDVVLDAAGVGMHGGPVVLFSSEKVDITEAIMKLVAATSKKTEQAEKKTESK